MRPIFASLTTLGCESTEVSQRISQAGCDPFPELKTELLKCKEFHGNPAFGLKHSCVARFFVANVHLNVTLGGVCVGGGSFPGFSSHGLRAVAQLAQQQRCRRAACS